MDRYVETRVDIASEWPLVRFETTKRRADVRDDLLASEALFFSLKTRIFQGYGDRSFLRSECLARKRSENKERKGEGLAVFFFSSRRNGLSRE